MFIFTDNLGILSVRLQSFLHVTLIPNFFYHIACPFNCILWNHRDIFLFQFWQSKMYHCVLLRQCFLVGNDFAQRAKRSGLSQFEALLASRTLRSGCWYTSSSAQAARQAEDHPAKVSRVPQLENLLYDFCPCSALGREYTALYLVGLALPHSPLPPDISFFQVPFPDSTQGSPPALHSPSHRLPPGCYPHLTCLPSLDHSFLRQCRVCFTVSFLLAHHFASYIIFINIKG